MNKHKSIRIIFIIFAVVIISFTFICFIAYQMVTRSLPEKKGEISITGIDEHVDVYRDNYSIPHISAQNEHDLYFIQGFVTSQDRFWQMDVIKRAAQGRLSEIFGISTQKYDTFILRLGFKRRAEKIVSILDPDAKRALEAYVEGINCYIRRDKLPIECKLLYYTPEEWTIEDCLSIMQLWEWQMSEGWKNDLIKELLTHEMGYNKTATLINIHKSEESVIKNNIFNCSKFLTADTLPVSYPFLGFDCNAFILSGEKSYSNIPLASVTVNTNPAIPCLFYEIQLTSKTVNMYGLSIPGIPGILIGYNQHILWGVTSSKDHAVHLRSIEDLLSYTSLITYDEEVRIAPDTVLNVTCYQLDNQPLVPVNRKKQSGAEAFIMIDWQGFTPYTLWNTYYQLGKAVNREEFFTAMQYNQLSSLNFFYADKSNNIILYPYKRDKVEDITQAVFPENITIVSHPESIKRIKELVSQQKKLSVQDLKDIQSDEFSLYAKNQKDKLINMINATDLELSIETDMLEKLTIWEGNMKAGSSEAAFFQVLLYKIFNNYLKDEISDSLFNIILSNNSLYYEVTESIIDAVYSEDVRSFYTEKHLIIDSYKEAVELLRNKLGNDISQWSWGALHTFRLQSPMGINSLIKSTYNLGPFASGGSFNTINKYSNDLKKLFDIHSVPAAKMIIDLQGRNSSASILSTGQSGQPFDDHYRDQVNRSIHNLYHSNITDTAKLADTGWDHLIIK